MRRRIQIASEPTLASAHKIDKATPTGFQSFIVYGERGVGKTAYAIKTFVNYYTATNGMSEKEAYKKALDSTLFRIKDVTDHIEEHIGSPTPITLWDDAGTFASSYRWFSHRNEVQLLQGLSDTIRSATNGLILTSPTPKGLLKFLRNYESFYVKISRRSGDYRRKATGYSQKVLPSGKTYVKKRFEDDYSCYLPKWVFDEYNEMREERIKELNKKLKEETED